MTRQWLGIQPAELCDQHLLGEHAEHHQCVGTLRHHSHGHAIVRGHVRAGDIDPAMLADRHDELAAELTCRGYEHDSPLGFDPAAYDGDAVHATVDRQANRADLRGRCGDCRRRMDEATKGEVVA